MHKPHISEIHKAFKFLTTILLYQGRIENIKEQEEVNGVAQNHSTKTFNIKLHASKINEATVTNYTINKLRVPPYPHKIEQRLSSNLDHTNTFLDYRFKSCKP
ncbi:hypothetical protein KC19_9G079700 [Ceratodon purpureus]|uniref:Uncharacterized protein n=1 Tax=Ceratodon purpureus TaxID=3225 RepID=A0A8T0GRK8_CERPU|nr:hypothetical protein KC19_9G079700 [Ceratodon purpureus]